MARVKKINEQSKETMNDILPAIAIFFAVCWIVLALFLSSLFRIHWFTPGDLSYKGAMYYHAIMVPLLILLYLLTQSLVPLKLVNSRIFSVTSIFAVFLVGIGSIFNTSKGISVASMSQIIGMVVTDGLGIILLVTMVIFAFRKKEEPRKTSIAFWLLLSSLIAILIATPLGHLAGWCRDIGAKSVPGLNTLFDATHITPDDFQDSLVASHSHLVVAALLCGLAAITAMYFQYQSRIEGRIRISTIGLRIMFISLFWAAGIYVVSAITGWEPPVLFASGPSGIPLDDVVLTLQEIGLLILMVGLSGSPKGRGIKPFSPIKANLRISIFANWIFGFIGAVILGIYIEFHEGFYGAGEAPALGALNDNIFIRAHLLYPFLLLPIIFAVTLAVGFKYNNSSAVSLWPKFFVWSSILGMLGGLVGEILWFTTRNDYVFIAAMIVMSIALVAGTVCLWPGVNVKRSYRMVS